MKNILITGGAGFIGANLVKWFLKHHYYNIINLDLLTYSGNLSNLADIENNRCYTFVKGDIKDRALLADIFQKYNIDTVIHLAAESHVDRSIEDPGIFVSTNVLGTQILLDTAKAFWKIDNNKYSTEYKDGTRYIQISTDEVYGSLGKEGKFCETTPLAPNSPYSASKASADMLAMSYYKTFGMPINITRCSNNYGPNQFPEKLIPLMINNCINSRPLPVYGDGLQIRDWLFVEDHCSAIDAVLHKGTPGEIYNIGGNNEKTNLEIIELILKKLEKAKSLIRYVEDRLGHDRRYSIDNSKISTELGWFPRYTFEVGIEKTINWYIDNSQWLKEIIDGNYTEYYDKMYGK